MQWKDKIDKNERPVIGILSQTLEDYMQTDTRFEGYKSYIMSSYVKYMESFGAEVVPIIVGETDDAVLEKLEKLDGVLFPGGDGDNFDLGKFVFNQVKKFNDEGQFYPAWSTCLGYENLVAYTADAGLDSWGIYPITSASLPLAFTKDPRQTRMFEGLQDLSWEFASHNFTYNSHRFGISPLTFQTDLGLNEFWDVTSVSLMPNGTAFTASIEAKNYPIFGTQFHPEKPSELWVDGHAINHEWESIML
eukprot:CAMPEP_0168612848 /NCGR_PEP_ID=MMETSP0449_2-20121227/3135_1 /TAXON_ID=1082188 /ORGANISM="Strombidium rassoulzadegani, Strain ras09" /LENGTH=247 /DNA_ID=CAMNT_0008653439 /DNA_START=217 /DNA_END=960 /DNA_ORIENTATION=+